MMHIILTNQPDFNNLLPELQLLFKQWDKLIKQNLSHVFHIHKLRKGIKQELEVAADMFPEDEELLADPSVAQKV